MSEQTLEIDLRPGSRVSILTDVDMDPDGFTAETVFEGTISRHIPQTRTLEFEENDMCYAEFLELVEEYDSIQVVRE